MLTTRIGSFGWSTANVGALVDGWRGRSIVDMDCGGEGVCNPGRIGGGFTDPLGVVLGV